MRRRWALLVTSYKSRLHPLYSPSLSRLFELRDLRAKLVLGRILQVVRGSFQVLQGLLDAVGSHLSGVKRHDGICGRLVFRGCRA